MEREDAKGSINKGRNFGRNHNLQVQSYSTQTRTN